MEYPTHPDEGPLVDPVVLRRWQESYREALDRHARSMIHRALALAAWSFEDAARELRLTLAELEAEMRRLGMAIPPRPT